MKSPGRGLALLASILVLAPFPLACPGPGVQEERAAAAPAPVALEDVLARARAAAGWPALAAARGGLRASGALRLRGTEGEFTLLFAPSGAFVRERQGRFAGAVGFDGTTAWSRDRSGLTRVLELEDRDVALLEHWIATGLWLSPAIPLRFAVLDAGEETVRLRVAVPDTPLEGTLEIDRASWLPRRLVLVTDGGENTWTFADWRPIAGLLFAHSLTARDAGGLADVYTAREGGPAPTFVRSPYACFPHAAEDTHFAPDVPAAVESRRAERTGHLLVHPRVNGEDVGWFIFDTGAGAMCIDDDAADSLDLEAFGEETAVGVAGTLTARFRAAKDFVLGPLTLDDPIFVELELGFLGPFLGVEIAGICGYDFLERAVVELTPSTGALAVHDPAAFSLAGAEWRTLHVDENHPVVEASFEGDRTGFFKLDTGAADTVTFHAPAVERLGLLEGREVKRTLAMGVGGGGTGYRGQLEWFALGGHRFEAPTVGFAMVATGAFRDAYTLGNIGQELLAPFRVVLDYPHRRIAFVPRDGEEPR
ncbi:MAG: retropepsin-like aspartic protease [Planctomycetota bacterium]